MVSHSNIIFATTIVQVGFTEAPVSSPTDKASAVDKETQYLVVFIKRHLADTDLEVFRVRNGILDLERKVRIIQVRLSVPFRPPQAWVLHLQLREILDIENDRLFLAGRQGDRLPEGDISNLPFQRTVYRIGIVVLHDYLGRQCSRSRIW